MSFSTVCDKTHVDFHKTFASIVSANTAASTGCPEKKCPPLNFGA